MLFFETLGLFFCARFVLFQFCLNVYYAARINQFALLRFLFHLKNLTDSNAVPYWHHVFRRLGLTDNYPQFWRLFSSTVCLLVSEAQILIL